MNNCPNMDLVNDIDDKVRFLVLFLDAGFSTKRISNVIRRSYSTVQDWVRRTNNGEDIREVHPGRGRKTTFSPEIKRKVVRAVRENPGRYSTRSLASKFEMSRTTAYNILREKGFTYGASHLVQNLTDEEKENRVKYCEEMLQDEKVIFETFFADEMGIALSDAHQTKSWGLVHTTMEVEIPRSNIRLNCWGAISFRGATSLKIYKESMNAGIYQKILNEHREELDALYPKGWYFAHDNLSSHSACEEWMEDEGFGRVLFPTYSPDLSPIENLWFTLKDSVAKDAPIDEEHLAASLKRNWEILTLPRNLGPYFLTLITRYEECIAQRGLRLPV